MLKKERIQKRVGKSRQAWSGGFGHRAGRSHSGRARQSDRSNPMSCVVDPPWIEVRRLGNWLSPKGQASRSSPMPLCQGKPLYQGKHEHTKSPNSRHSLRVSISHLVVFSRVPTATWCALRSQSGPATLSVVCESVAISVQHSVHLFQLRAAGCSRCCNLGPSVSQQHEFQFLQFLLFS